MPHACHRFWKCHKTLMFCSLLTRCTIPCACHAKRHLNLQKWSEPLVFETFWLGNVLRATTACTFSTAQLPKVVQTWGGFSFFTCKCASRHSGMHFFHVATLKSAPKLKRFVHFDFEMCFAPQRHALFRHLNCQKWSGAGVLCTFWLRNVLRATTAYTFSTSQLPKAFRTCGVLVFCTFWLGNVLRPTTACNFSSLIWPDGSAPAALASILFDAPEPQTIGKTQCFATFLPFRAPASSFFWLFLFSDLLSSALLSSTLLFSLTLPISACNLSILSEVWLLNFLRLLRELACAMRQPGPCVRALCEPVAVLLSMQEHDPRAAPLQCNVKQTLSSHFTLHSWHPTLHTSHLHFISTLLPWALLISFHVFPYVS